MKFRPHINISLSLAALYLIASFGVLGSAIAQSSAVKELSDKIEEMERRETQTAIDDEKRYSRLDSDVKIMRNDINVIREDLALVKQFGFYLIIGVVGQIVAFVGRWMYDRLEKSANGNGNGQANNHKASSTH